MTALIPEDRLLVIDLVEAVPNNLGQLIEADLWLGLKRDKKVAGKTGALAIKQLFNIRVVMQTIDAEISCPARKI